MKKTKEMYPGGFYLFTGSASANSSFIEDKEEALNFIKRFNEKFVGYLTIHDFLISKDGWQLLVELQEEDIILKSYERDRQKSRKLKEGCKLGLIWKIISDRLRTILSNFVVFTNKKNGRTGSKVAKSYERFWFETFEEAKSHLEKMRNQLVSLSQRLRKYRSSKLHFRISAKECRGAIFLCSLNIEPGEEVQYFSKGCLELISQNMNVLRKLVIRTLELQNGPHNNHFWPNMQWDPN